MNIFVDIDQTICTSPKNLDYREAIPIQSNIQRINSLYEEGHTITYWTARGTVSGIDWREVTEKQFSEWGVKYHNLQFGKPSYDLFICDKAINSDTFFKEI